MDLQPLGDRLVVEVLDEEDVTTSGIVLPDTAKEKPQRGKARGSDPARVGCSREGCRDARAGRRNRVRRRNQED